jgi:hypothetical protein
MCIIFAIYLWQKYKTFVKTFCKNFPQKHLNKMPQHNNNKLSCYVKHLYFLNCFHIKNILCFAYLLLVNLNQNNFNWLFFNWGFLSQSFCKSFLRKLLQNFRIFVTNISWKGKVNFAKTFAKKRKKTFVPFWDLATVDALLCTCLFLYGELLVPLSF